MTEQIATSIGTELDLLRAIQDMPCEDGPRDRLAHDSAKYALDIGLSSSLLLGEKHTVAFQILLRSLSESMIKLGWGLQSDENATSLEVSAHNDFRKNLISLVNGGALSFQNPNDGSSLNDTILALGLMICFYYGLTAVACTWYFRHSLFNSVRHFFFRLVCPVVGGVGLFVVFAQTAMDSLSPEFGSGSEIFGVGLVFILGVGILALGAVVMLVMSRTHPRFFRGETLKQDTPALVVPE